MLPERIILPDWPALPVRIGTLTTLRTGGVSLAPYDDGQGSGGFNLGDHVGDRPENVLANRHLLSQLLPGNPSWLNQVHGTIVVNLDENPGNLTADASISTQPGRVCAVLTADCLPVLLSDARGGLHGIVAAAHAGWRGLLNGVLENTVEKMQAAGAKRERILVWLGPAIGPSQFEVGEEVREKFMNNDVAAASAFTENQNQAGKFYADIYQLARQRLQRMGISQVAGGNYCTFSDPGRFYSFRRDGVTGRMASLIWIK